MESSWEMIKEKGERFLNLLRGDDMIILQNQDAL